VSKYFFLSGLCIEGYMKQLIMILFIVCIITSCGQSKFDKSMRAGKDYIQSGHFEEAINQFDIALIEKPTDKDAQILMERSKQELDNKKSKEILAKYQEENSQVFFEYRNIWLETNTKEVSGVFEKLNTIEKLKVIYNNSLELGRKYKKYSKLLMLTTNSLKR
jgi:hypothetical protein